MDRSDKKWLLFITCLKIGALTFGGGYAMIPLIKRELVEHHKWMEEKDILDIVAIAESTPGPIAINIATFVGYRVAGYVGAILATLGVVVPSFFTIVVISYAMDAFQHLKIVQYAFWGIRVGVLALLINAFLSMAKQCPKERIAYFIAFVSFILVGFSSINTIFVIIGFACVGMFCNMFVKRRVKNDLP